MRRVVPDKRDLDREAWKLSFIRSLLKHKNRKGVYCNGKTG